MKNILTSKLVRLSAHFAINIDSIISIDSRNKKDHTLNITYFDGSRTNTVTIDIDDYNTYLKKYVNS